MFVYFTVVPIKSCYSPVTLNPPPLPTKKAEGSNVDKKVAETASSAKSATLLVPVSDSVPVITVASDENSVSNHKALQEVAELHAKLQAALQQQVCLVRVKMIAFQFRGVRLY